MFECEAASVFTSFTKRKFVRPEGHGAEEALYVGIYGQRSEVEVKWDLKGK
jgi:hypothetical protein